MPIAAIYSKIETFISIIIMNSVTKYYRHREIINWVREQENFQYTNKEISSWTNFDESKLSRFFTGKRDFKAGDFFYLLECMPENFQEVFWSRYHPTNLEIIDLETIVDSMDLADLGKLLKLIGDKISQHN